MTNSDELEAELDEELEEERQYRESLAILSEIAGRSYASGERIVSEGEPGTEIYFVVSGSVAVFLGQGESRRDLLSLCSGDIFGEMALLDQLPRSASVEAREPSRLVRFDRRLFYHLVGEYPILAKRVIELMGRRMRRMDSQYKLESGYRQD